MAQITETRKASNALYQSLKDNGFNSLPSEEVFYNTLQDSVQASNIYQSLKDNGFKLPSKESFYKTLIEGYGQQPATPTASADGTYTESQLEEMGGGDMTDKAPENGTVVVQKQDKKKDLNVPNSPLQPEQYKIPKLFDYTQRKKDYSNQDWNKKQEAGEDYNPEVKISVKTEGSDFIISIADNGEGMTEEVKQRLYENFFTTKPVGKGTGLGMGITRDIIENKHGGKISFESTEGEGTIFTFTIPVRK